jgi:hypothetical protein
MDAVHAAFAALPVAAGGQADGGATESTAAAGGGLGVNIGDEEYGVDDAAHLLSVSLAALGEQ